jgi:multidrug resistance efflux pump
MIGRVERIIRSRMARVALAASMAATGLWAFAPYLLSDIGEEAYVNAPLIRLVSPIAGTVTDTLPPVGTYLDRSRIVRLVTARSIDANALGALVGQRDALAAGLKLATRQLGELISADTRLSRRAAVYGRAAVDRGFAARATVERADSAATALHARCAAYTARAAAAAGEAGAARSGLYFVNGGSDTPYVEQERDRLLLRRQELDTTAVDARARLDQLDARIAAEQLRLEQMAAYDAALPGSGVVWAVAASPGVSVVPGSVLLEVADCRHRFIEVTLPERRIESLTPGGKVDVRLIGAGGWESGHIVRSAGAAVRHDVAMVAAMQASNNSRAMTVEVALPMAPDSAVSRRCDIGRLAEVRFPRWRG